MLITIPNVLSAQQLGQVKTLLEKAKFVDGKLSAGMAARKVKHNEEAAQDADLHQQLNQIVMGALVNHPTFQLAAFPLRVATAFYARYRPGMTYGDHVDDPVMGPPGGQYRSDVSTTVFLNEPGEYEGGELVVRTPFGDQQTKLAAGSAVVYPSASLHHVAEVTSGERIVAVTWCQSMIREAARRELLFELGSARDVLLREQPDAPSTKKIDISYANLVRMWAEV